MEGSPVLMLDLHLWNCLSFVPFLLSLHVHCFPDSHVFHGLLNDQQPRTLRQIEKGLDVGDVLQYFHFRDRLAYPR